MLQMLKYALVFWMTTSMSSVFSQTNCSELFFSEYIEGSSLNKGLEIYNPSMTTIDLSDYSVKIFSNGNPNSGITIQLSGMLEGDSVYVITHSGAAPALKNHADSTVGSLTFNGDDAVALVSNTDTVDVIGVIGTDPGSAWSNNGVSTANQTMLRNSSVQVGIGPDSTSFDPSIEWTSLGQNDFSNIGIHTSTCPRCTADTTQLTNAICQGDSYTFNGQTITTAGVYYDTLQNIGGCDSILVLTLTVNQNPVIVANSTADTICQGDNVTLTGQGGTAYIWDNNVTDGVAITPNATAMYTVVGQDANGCLGIDSTAVVVESFTPHTISVSTQDSVLCENEGTTFNAVVSNGGNSAVIQWKNTGNDVGNNSTTYNSPAQSSNYFVFAEYTTFGVCGYTTASNAIGVTVNAIDSVNIADTICTGESLAFGSQTLTTGGVYYETYTNIAGCDSVVKLTLVENQLPTVTTMASADTVCMGGAVTLSGQGAVTYTWNNGVTDGVAFNPNQSSDYVVTGTDANGCMDTDTVTVVVTAAPTPTISIATPDSMLCDGEGTSFSSVITNGGQNFSYQWKRNGNNVGTGLSTYNSLSSSTNHGDVITCELTTTGVCGTTIVSNAITISVSGIDAVSVNDTICTGESLVFGTQTLTSGGVYTETFTNIAGCDSVVELTLIENQLPTVVASTSADTLCFGADVVLSGQGALTYTWNNGVVDGVAFTPNQSDSYVVTGVAANGCSNTDTVEVVISNDTLPTVQIMTPDSMLCDGEGTSFSSIVTHGGQNINYQWKRNGNNVGTGLTTYNSLSSSTNHGDVITLEVTTSGTCGTTITSNSIMLTVSGIDSVTINETICSNDSLVFGGQTLMNSGTYTETFVNMAGCDSVVTLELVVNQAELITIQDTICEGEAYQFGNTAILQAGTYTDSLQTTLGCDSIIVLELNVIPTETSTQNVFLCTGDSVAFGGAFYSTSGVYMDTLTSVTGCDSIAVLELIVGNTDTLEVSDIICSGDSVVFGTQVLTQTGLYTEIFTSTGGCDSIVTMELEVVQSTSSQISETICANESIEFGGQNITTSGVYYDTIINAAGCDSVITFTLTVLPEMIDTLAQTICSGDSVMFGGIAYSQTGLFTDSLQSATGCDSIVVLDLTVLMPFDTIVNESICNGSSLIFGTQTITQPGTYTETFQNIYGCDSVVTAIVGFGNSSDTAVVEEICQGEFYTFGSQVLTETGSYTETFTNASGCDSTVTLTLSVKANPIVSITQSGGDLICTQGDAYQWFFNGDSISGATSQIYTPTENGVYTVDMTAFNGCSDQNNYTIQNVSIAELSLTDVLIAPNPSTGIYNVAASIDFKYEVYNVLGELVINDSNPRQNQMVNISNEENGVYLLVLTTVKGEKLIKRIIKK
jgi:hypothetical protein